MTDPPHEVASHPPAPAPAAGDLAGKTAIITGSNSGLGLECARQLLTRGLSKLVLAVRDEGKGAAAREDLAAGRDLAPDAIEVWPLDYASYESVTGFASRAAGGLANLDIVVLNAGVYRIPRVVLATGHEEDVQVNYLSTALLAVLLLPVLKARRRPGGGPGRLTVVSSVVAAWSRLRPPRDGGALLAAVDGLAEGKPFDHHQQYCTSKLLGQLFLAELIQRVPPSAATICYVNPGLCYGSSLARDGEGTLLGFIVGIAFRVFGSSCASGAQALVDGAANHGEEVHGQYLDGGKPTQLASVVYTPEGREMAQTLWKETMSELSFASIEDVIGALAT